MTIVREYMSIILLIKIKSKASSINSGENCLYRFTLVKIILASGSKFKVKIVFTFIIQFHFQCVKLALLLYQLHRILGKYSKWKYIFPSLICSVFLSNGILSCAFDSVFHLRETWCFSKYLTTSLMHENYISSCWKHSSSTSPSQLTLVQNYSYKNLHSLWRPKQENHHLFNFAKEFCVNQ